MEAHQAEQNKRLEELQAQIASRWAGSAQAASSVPSSNTEPAVFGVMLVSGGPVGTVPPKFELYGVPLSQLPMMGAMILNFLVQMGPRVGEEACLMIWTPPLPATAQQQPARQSKK
jgi:hypothetical protein